MKIISFCLYGNNPFYYQGAIENAKLKEHVYGTEWETWFYVGDDVPKEAVEELKLHADRVIVMNHDSEIINQTFWRFLPILDKSVEVVCFRDTDSIITSYEYAIVQKWLQSKYTANLIRDHPTHLMPIMAGMWGLKLPLKFDFMKIMSDGKMYWTKRQYCLDQFFLANLIYPLIKEDSYIYDTYNQIEPNNQATMHYGHRDYFMGKRNELTQIPTHQPQSKCIYFHKNIDLYNTEQLGAFMYEFMEQIQIAKLLKRKLVIPNCFIAPRNNEKIIEKKHIYLKSLSCVPITDYIDLSLIADYVELVPLSEFYEMTYESPAVSIIYSHTKECIFKSGNQKMMFTPFGNIKLQEIAVNITNMPNFKLVGGLQSDQCVEIHQYDNWIVIDYVRGGNPNWHHMPQLDYFSIRMSIIYNEWMQDKANAWAKSNQIKQVDTLMVHWRCGDRLLQGDMNKYETKDEDTHNYYTLFNKYSEKENMVKNIASIQQKHPEIKQVFLVHNNKNKEETEYLKTELSKRGLTPLEYEWTEKMEDNQRESIMQQLIGAQCKYHLHGPVNYERMSAFGRWMIEERKRHYWNNSYITDMGILDGVYFLTDIPST